MEKNYFVIRTTINEAFEDIRNEFLAGRLRQGWGPKGADLRGDPASFITALNERWKDIENTPRRYSILLPMTKIKRGDIIIVPRLSIKQYSIGKYFTIAECTEEYIFEPLPTYNDYGHIIGVRALGTWDYRSADDSANLLGKLLMSMPFSKAVNTIKNPETIQAIENLIDSLPLIENTSDSSTPIENFGANFPRRQQEKFLNDLRRMTNLENFLAEVFRKIPGVKTVSQSGSDLIVTYTLERIKGVEAAEQTWIVQINDMAIEQFSTNIENFNAALGIFLTTNERTQSLEADIKKVVLEMSKKNISVYLVAGVEVAQLIFRYGSTLLI